MPTARLLFFWHIPFPPVEIFRTLPWRRLILEGLLGSDLIGFHTPEYSKNFMEAASDLLGARTEGNAVYFAGRITRVITRPIGIDYAAIDGLARSAQIEGRIQELSGAFGKGKFIIGVERMDYTKGIVERLRGVEYLLEQHPELLGKFNLIQIVTPSRDGVESYRQKKREIDEMVGRVNGRFSDGIWIPIRYLYRSFSPKELIAYYRSADIALVTPLRDGLNLVAKEFVASRIHNDGSIVLSEFAGVADQLPEAIITNPYSQEDVAGAIENAIRMPKSEQKKRMTKMRERIKSQDLKWWLDGFLNYFDNE
jgi:trehalose 6-phosphate synthase